MYTLQFYSPAPLDHVCRALDIVRKMGLDLTSLHVSGTEGGDFRVSIVMSNDRPMSTETLRRRVASFNGIRDLACRVDREEVEDV